MVRRGRITEIAWEASGGGGGGGGGGGFTGKKL